MFAERPGARFAAKRQRGFSARSWAGSRLCGGCKSEVEAVAAEGGVDVAVEVAGAGQAAGETAGKVAGKSTAAGNSTAAGKVAGDLRIRYPL